MVFEILGALANMATEKAIEVKEDYEKNYSAYSEKTEEWDDQRLINEYKKACNNNNFARKMALAKLLQERGLIKG